MKVFALFQRAGRDIRGRPVDRVFGLTTMWRGEENVVWRKCNRCSGGMQLLDTSTNSWGPIPYEARREQKDRTGYSSANIRECPSCHGAGSHWIPESLTRNEDRS